MVRSVTACAEHSPRHPVPWLNVTLGMTTVTEITRGVRRLPKRALARFRKWFAEYDAAEWDRQLESDVDAGRLDALVRRARRDHRASRTKAL
jgi:hypothetical protein